MADASYPMTRVAANALMLALLLLVARLFGYAVDFVDGWRLDSDLFELTLVASIATLVGVLGAAFFGVGLLVQTLRGRAHPRYVTAFAVIVVLWFASLLLLPSPYRAGVTRSLWTGGVDERALVDFAAAVRALPAAPAHPGGELLLGSVALRSLQSAHRRIFDTLPHDASVDVAADRVDIHWGGLAIGVHGVSVADRGPSPAAEPAIGAVVHRISPRVFLFDHYD